MKNLSWANIPGYFDFQDIYDQAVKDAPSDRPSHFVEVGVLFGRSLFYLAEAVKKSGKPIIIEAVDPFFKDWKRGDLRRLFGEVLKTTDKFPNLRCQDPVFLPEWYKEDGELDDVLPMGLLPGVLEAGRAIGVEGLISFSVGKGQKVPYRDKLDFVFLDAEHTYEDTLELLLYYLPRMAKGGVIAGHDFDNVAYPGVKRAVQQVFGGDYKIVDHSFVHRVKGPLSK